MSFRSRLLPFFTIIVVVPMGAVALVLFSITSQSEIGKADARIAEGLRVGFALYRQHRAEATPQLRRIARGRFEELQEPVGPPVSIGVFTESQGITASIGQSRVLIGVILLGFLVLALVLSVFIVRALQGQIDQFLGAARRLAKGDFTTPVP